MSQKQRPLPQVEPQPVKYGDVLPVSEKLAHKPLAPKDAALAQAAESHALGHTQKGGPAAVMQSAADVNVRRGVLGKDDATEAGRQHGVEIYAEKAADGKKVVTEAIGGEVVGKFVVAGEEEPPSPPLSALSPLAVTIGQALESAVKTSGDKPVDKSDAAVIQAMELRATRRKEVIPGGVASKAQSAAKHNERTPAEDKKIKLRDVLKDATQKLTDDKAATKDDADAAVAAEIRKSRA